MLAHGPRQPSSLLKLVLVWQATPAQEVDSFWFGLGSRARLERPRSRPIGSELPLAMSSPHLPSPSASLDDRRANAPPLGFVIVVLLGLSNAISLHAGRLGHSAVGLAMAGRASVVGIFGAESAGFAVCRRRRIMGETCAEFDQVRRSAAIRDLNWAAAGTGEWADRERGGSDRVR